jgi:phosphoribosylamine--glycine ligase
MAADKQVLVVGKGGREHALAWKLAQSPQVARIVSAPGSPGLAALGPVWSFDAREPEKLVAQARKERIDLVVIGPEDPLAAGLTDQMEAAGLRVFGPSKLAARLEASKVFAKDMMRHANIPTAEYRTFDHPDPARAYILNRLYPCVVKADGLAAGKGVIVCSNQPEALAAIERIMVREEFGRAAGRKVVVEKRLEGREVSLLTLVGGRAVVPLPPAQDYKAAHDGHKGPNTGGMGAFCPAPILQPELFDKVDAEVFVPIVHAMKRSRAPLKGLLYAGLMLTSSGLRVLEFNCRFGDPETQVLMMRLQSDLYGVLAAVADEMLGEYVAAHPLVWDERPAVCVILASRGYPGNPEIGQPIMGIEQAAALSDVQVFHSGTAFQGQRLVTAGGRVLSVTALGADLAAARARAYEAVKLIHFPGMFYRNDIAGLEPPAKT